MTDRELMQQALNIMESTHFAVADNVKHSVVMEHVAAIELLRARLAEKEPEPVVWMYQDKSTNEVRFQKHMRDFVDHGATDEVPLYAAPQQREWQGLTDEEIRNEANHHVFDESFFNGAVWARGKIKEKNNG